MDGQKNNCPFCSPVVEKATFAESNNFRAVYNIAPILPGHCLIIPKNHLSSLLDIPTTDMTEMMLFSRKIIRVLSKAFGTSSYDWTIQEGQPAGQTIEHLHIHIIPRTADDLPEPGDWYPRLEASEPMLIDSFLRSKYSYAELKSIVEKLSRIFMDQGA